MKIRKILLSLFVLTLMGMQSYVSVSAVESDASEGITGEFTFNLHANVYDYGEAIDALSFSIDTIDPTGLAGAAIDPATIDADTFTILATAKNPYSTLPADAPQYGLYENVERGITNVAVSTDGRTVSIDLMTAYNGAGQGTLNYVAGDVARNVSMDITYTVVQNKEFSLFNGTVIKADSKYIMGEISSPEVEKFTPVSFSGTKGTIEYQQYIPSNATDTNKHPLIIWFHGNGEGGYGDIKNNNSQLRGNRGAVAFATEQAQTVFGGAYVIAPQAPDTWYNNYTNGYIDTMGELIDNYVKNNNVDPDRIYVYGCSAGGYMTTRMAIENPTLFAAVVPTCAAVNVATQRGGVETTEAEIKTLADNNVWFVHSADDTTVEAETSSTWMHSLLPNSIYTQYDTVTLDGVSYPGHWSWIYTALNMPVNGAGENIWQWTAKQKLVKVEEEKEIPKIPGSDEEETGPESDEKPVTNDKKDKRVVKTADTTIVSTYFGLSMLALSGLVVVRKRETTN